MLTFNNFTFSASDVISCKYTHKSRDKYIVTLLLKVGAGKPNQILKLVLNTQELIQLLKAVSAELTNSLNNLSLSEPLPAPSLTAPKKKLKTT